MPRSVPEIYNALLTVTKKGPLMDWCERIAGVLARHTDMSRMETHSEPWLYAQNSVRRLSRLLGGDHFAAFDADVAAMEASMGGAEKDTLVRVTATIRHIGTQVVDSNMIYILVLGNVRALDSAHLIDSSSTVTLSAHAAVSPMLALARSARDPLGKGVSDVTIGYVKLGSGTIHGEIREFLLHLDG